MKRFLQIGLVLVALAWCIPANATETFVQAHTNASCTVSPCSPLGFTTIAAGSFMFERLGGASVLATAGASGVGTWVIPTGCVGNADCHSNDATAGNVAVAYILSTTGTTTAPNCTFSGTGNDCTIAVFTFTNGPMALDVGAIRDQSVTGTSYAGTSAGTLTGTNDIVLQYGVTNGTFNACPNSAANPANFDNGEALCGLVNSTNVAAGTFGLSLTGRAALGAIAFKEAVASSKTSLPWYRMPTVGPSMAISILFGILIGVGYSFGGKRDTSYSNTLYSVRSVAGDYVSESQQIPLGRLIELRKTPQGVYETVFSTPKVS